VVLKPKAISKSCCTAKQVAPAQLLQSVFEVHVCTVDDPHVMFVAFSCASTQVPGYGSPNPASPPEPGGA